jgi:hypothetical protein
MRTNQKNKLHMYNSVDAKLAENKPKLSFPPALPAALQRFDQTVQLIEAKETERSDQTTGKLEVRDEAEDILVELLVQVSSSLIAYASSSKNTELYQKAKIKKGMLHRLRDTELLLKAKSMLTLALQYNEQLVPFGITAEIMTAFQQAIPAFETASENVDKGFTGRSGARISVYDAFDQADAILKDQIDTMMESVKKVDYQLYNEYWAARVIHDLGRTREPKKPNQPVASSAMRNPQLPSKSKNLILTGMCARIPGRMLSGCVGQSFFIDTQECKSFKLRHKNTCTLNRHTGMCVPPNPN